MAMWSRNRLGLVIGQHRLTVVEMRGGNGRREIHRAAVFEFPAGAGLDKPEALGLALRAFLQAQGFGAGHGRPVVLGLTGWWLLTKTVVLPPAPPQALVGMLRIQAERDLSTDAHEWVWDVAGELTPGQPLLLAGARHAPVQQALALAAAAGLTVRRVTSAAVALAQCGPGSGESADLVVHLGDGGTDVMLRHRGQVERLQHLDAVAPADVAEAEDLADTIRRTMLGWSGPAAQRVVIWNAAGAPAEAVAAIGRRLGLAVEAPKDLSAIGRVDASVGRTANPLEYAAAAACAAVPGEQTVNLLRSRLSAKPRRRLGRRGAWAVAIAAVVLLAAGLWGWDCYRDYRDIRDMTQQQAAMAASVKTARAQVERVRLARGWYDTRPRVLDAIRQLTMAFPLEGSIWVISLDLREDLTGSLSGKATSNEAVLAVLDKMKASSELRDVKLQYLRQGDRRSRDTTFALSFSFVGHE